MESLSTADEKEPHLTVPVGGVGNRLRTYAPELEAPTGSNMLVTFTLP